MLKFLQNKAVKATLTVLVVIAILYCIYIYLFASPWPHRSSSVTAEALFSSHEFTIEVKCKYDMGSYRAYEGTWFITDAKYKELQRKLARDIRVTAENIEGVTHGSLIRRDNRDGTTDHFFFTGNNATKLFYICNMGALFVYDIENVTDRGYTLILLPLHLISDKRLVLDSGLDPHIEAVSAQPSMYEEILYETHVGYDEFLVFYTESGWYDVEGDGESIIIKGFSQNPSARASKTHLVWPLKIEFETQAEQKFFKYTFIDEP